MISCRTLRTTWPLLALIVVALVTTLSACSSSSNHLDATAFNNLTKQTGVVVVDVRTPQEFASGHIQGAVNIDIENPSFAQNIAALDKNATYAVYCHSGNRSGKALDQMSQVGFKNTSDLAGGIQAWQSAGFPIVV